MRAYRWALQYDRRTLSRVNPLVEDVEQDIADAEVAELLHADSIIDLDIDGDGYRHILTPESF